MSDVLNPDQRHFCMSRIKGKNTKPELLVRHYLWHSGLRYRLNVKNLPGKPDIVLPKYHTVIFVNGCFWHGHSGCAKASIPATNSIFWTTKIRSNIERDELIKQSLEKLGWIVITVWQCELSASKIDKTMNSLIRSLSLSK